MQSSERGLFQACTFSVLKSHPDLCGAGCCTGAPPLQGKPEVQVSKNDSQALFPALWVLVLRHRESRDLAWTRDPCFRTAQVHVTIQIQIQVHRSHQHALCLDMLGGDQEAECLKCMQVTPGSTTCQPCLGNPCALLQLQSFFSGSLTKAVIGKGSLQR